MTTQSSPLVRLLVVAGLIEHPTRPDLLVARRYLSDPPGLAGLWEFPGGKVEPGEEPRAALRREIVEELGIATRVGAVVETLHSVASHREIVILCYRCTLEKGVDPESALPLEAEECRWVPVAKLDTLEFVAADKAFVARLATDARRV
jgi:8-oxo-dGTP diphosphatase